EECLAPRELRQRRGEVVTVLGAAAELDQRIALVFVQTFPRGLVEAHALGARRRRDLRRQNARRLGDRALGFRQHLGPLAAGALDRLGDEQRERFALVLAI